jgi:cytochrome c oxidase cbb3-type subunit 2
VSPEAFRHGWAILRRDGRGIGAVTATYVTFLLFAQFGFLNQVKHDLGTAAGVRSVMTWMGAAGLAVSLATAALLAHVRAARLFRFGLGACATVALASLVCHGPWSLRILGALIGGALACVTVALATALRDLLSGRSIGLVAGFATGLAYWISNIPVLFDAAPWVRAVVPAALCIVSLTWPPRDTGDDGEALHRGPLPGLARVLPMFLVLIWLDSAAFAIIQDAASLKALSWGNGAQQVLQGTVHLAAAVTAGWFLDRGRFLSVLLATWGLFFVAFSLLEHGDVAAAVGAPMYAAGISLYSVALVVYPSALGEGRLPARWRAGLLFGVAGWVGSGLGVGMAQDLGHIPPAFLAVSGGVLLVAGFASTRPAITKAVRLSGAALGVGLLGSLSVLRGDPSVSAPRSGDDAERTAAVARGHRVYIAEGCIHCHSQYVRPGSPDETWWGPHRTLADSERPPLIGNRRQGPDLLNVGNRRGAAWQELHLRRPRMLSPGSRMPSYDHLFAAGGSRGPDLVAYLAFLGEATGAERAALTQRPVASPPITMASLGRGATLFGSYCMPCHGPTGYGDGPFATSLGHPVAMNLHKGPLWFLGKDPGAAPREALLARIVRYGLPGTSMPGHESLPPQDVADLVGFVESLVGSADAPLAWSGR